ncbi:NAD(P)-dependent dehydrogenase (short-subunit alcohol dehydrogenase family) [Streptomyces sp. B3I7]|uniref:SDR family NAD(P)-dependent oxidoreductase n=1 Tax=Streptomyces sp. B3I7 TaxID=3042269 RepID=UPI002787840A|nr:SDR family NAD(P)-dependent oxidoreductase [Streptomyces sp. B3I7]MDQ0808311.1 NAD(P)-dependent dehydrogenase (short-subunit alcohol dehydrogenase family) [Streptomyces sp. B3I7]
MTRVWFITGSSRGLGRHLVEAALANGDHVVATARRPEQIEALSTSHADRLFPVRLDVTEPGAPAAALRTAVERFGRVDIVVNNAGYGSIAPIEDVTDEDFRSQVDTNLYGPLSVSRAAVPLLRRQGSGHIIQIGSIGGRVGAPGFGVHQAMKWALEGMSEALANEVAPFGIKVTIVEPGGLRTDYNGSSRVVGHIRPEYHATAGAIAAALGANSGQEPGDPAKAAQAIVGIAGLEEPPLRLLLGRDAVAYAEAAAKARDESDRRWRAVSLSIDADDEATGDELSW